MGFILEVSIVHFGFQIVRLDGKFEGVEQRSLMQHCNPKGIDLKSGGILALQREGINPLSRGG